MKMEIVKNWKKIRDEGLEKIRTVPISTIRRPELIDYNIIQRESWVRGWTNDVKWLNYGIIYGDAYLSWADKCPRTCELLRKIDNINMAGFSLLKPYGYIPIHTDTIGGEGGSPHVYHLGLSIPDTGECLLGVGNEKYKEQNGKLIQFDDRLEHWANNNSSKDRLILYIKIINPS